MKNKKLIGVKYAVFSCFIKSSFLAKWLSEVEDLRQSYKKDGGRMLMK